MTLSCLSVFSSLSKVIFTDFLILIPHFNVSCEYFVFVSSLLYDFALGCICRVYIFLITGNSPFINI
jgi:hypothetical protein